MNNTVKVQKPLYTFELNTKTGYMTLFSRGSGKKVYAGHIGIAVDTLKGKDQMKGCALATYKEDKQLVLDIKSPIWEDKQISIEFEEDFISFETKVYGHDISIKDIQYLLNRTYQSGETEYNKLYLPRFDWFVSEVMIATDGKDSLGCQQWLSPPPFCYAFVGEQESISCGVMPEMGAYNFLSMDYDGSKGPVFSLTYEGHTHVDGSFISPKLIIGFGEKDYNKAVDKHIKYMRNNGYLPFEDEKKKIPAWWLEPIFCSWGQMRYDYREDHDGHENGSFINVTHYSTEPLHRHYMAIMEEQDIHPGTIIIDMGWAKDPALGHPSEKKWQDMRAFIDERHAKGQRVLLWYTPVVTQGLPIEACMTLEGRPVAPDPTSPAYIDILNKEIHRMIGQSEGCLNADGFKIDFTQCTPSEEGRFTSYLDNFWALINEDNEKYFYKPLKDRTHLIKTYGDKWGVEILRGYIELIYKAMKDVKEEAVLITHTANPYFSDIVDILRLNDLDGECDNVLGVMKNRATIAKMCSQNWLIDTDNDLMYDKKKWREYVRLQPQLGIPDTYYIKSIATSGELFDQADYDLIKEVWTGYRNNICV